MLQQAIILSAVLGLLSSEFLGLFSGGLVSAGYLALYVAQPLRIVSTILVSLSVVLVVRLLEKVMILYGRRRFVLCMLLAIILAWSSDRWIHVFSFVGQDIRIVGYMIPGLIANDCLSHGILKTLCSLLVIAAVVWVVVVSGVIL